MPLYAAYGLQIDSELALPGLPSGSAGPSDVKIRYGSVPESLPGSVGTGTYFEATTDSFLLRVKDTARYLVSEGQEILIDRDPAALEDVLRTYLMGSAFGALLHQRSLLVMHASCIQTVDGAVLFVGPSGQGKSTLLAALVDRGYAMLSDDVTAIDMGSGSRPVAYPSFPSMRLGTDSAAEMGRQIDFLPRVRYAEKHVVPVENFCAESLPVQALYALGVHDEDDIRLEPVEARKRFAIVGNNTYRYGFLDSLGLRSRHFEAAAQLARSTRISQITRPAASFLLDELVDRLVQELGEPVKKRQEQEVG